MMSQGIPPHYTTYIKYHEHNQSEEYIGSPPVISDIVLDAVLIEDFVNWYFAPSDVWKHMVQSSSLC